ncbi:MAG: DUF1127 domain-containing protein [Acidiferrobacterales bacterium]
MKNSNTQSLQGISVARRTPSHEEIQYYLRRARQLRADMWSGYLATVSQTIKSALRPLFGGISALLQRLHQAMARNRKRRQAIRHLMRLDDWVLQDIGMRRDRIHYTVDSWLGAPEAQAHGHKPPQVAVATRLQTGEPANEETLPSAA